MYTEKDLEKEVFFSIYFNYIDHEKVFLLNHAFEKKAKKLRNSMAVTEIRALISDDARHQYQ